MLKTRNILS